ncbi:hypothetical protein IP91_00423 [Pseudoduganella lurida]|uniref:Uncharacterized protein n=1 Tax=Pseudoduganella lurida TaxID=1036180 RepID=A0A562RJW8_9BURK|nr:hypothetical protein [Pseudoduganella lurida]TWI69355.1 hypothetical protein IP91_00423 [Pseudoduganella lurida]
MPAFLPPVSPGDRRLIDYRPELELPAGAATASPVRDEYGEMDFAARLLEARSAEELRPVLRDLANRAAGDREAVAALRDPVVRVLDRAARLVFPLDATRAPADLKRKAAGIFGLELEGLSPEDKEFEVARRFVRLATDASEAALARAGRAPEAALQQGLVQAARRNAPGLLRQRAAADAWPTAGQ